MKHRTPVIAVIVALILGFLIYGICDYVAIHPNRNSNNTSSVNQSSTASAQTLPKQAEAAPQPDYKIESLVTNEVIVVSGRDFESAIRQIGKSYTIKSIAAIVTTGGYAHTDKLLIIVESRHHDKLDEIIHPLPEYPEAR